MAIKMMSSTPYVEIEAPGNSFLRLVEKLPLHIMTIARW